MGGRIDWGFGIDRYTLLYLKQIINKDLLHSTANPARKKKSEKSDRKYKRMGIVKDDIIQSKKVAWEKQ